MMTMLIGCEFIGRWTEETGVYTSGDDWTIEFTLLGTFTDHFYDVTCIYSAANKNGETSFTFSNCIGNRVGVLLWEGTVEYSIEGDKLTLGSVVFTRQ